MERALVQSTNFTSSVASERHGQLRGSGKTIRTVRMLCGSQGPALGPRSLPGLRSNASGFGTVAIPNLGFHSTTSRGKASRFVPKAMFERFTVEGLQDIVLAQAEARRLGLNFVGTEQILLGLIGEGTGIAAKVLKSLGINLEDARVEVEKIVGRGCGFVAGEAPFTPRAKRVLQFSIEEARRLGHNYIASEHLLLGLVREGEGMAARVLENLGADLLNIRALAIRMIAERAEAVGAGVGGGSSSNKMPKPAEEGKLPPIEGFRFTEKAAKAIMLAQAEQKRLDHNFFSTELILLGLIGEGAGIAAKVLKSMGINLKDARVEVEKLIGRGRGFVDCGIPFTPRAKRVLELSHEEARQLGHSSIGSAHLLLGLLRVGEGLGVRVLENLGADPGNIRAQVSLLLKLSFCIRIIGENMED